MSLTQLIYTSRCVAAMTSQMSYDVSCKSVYICEKLGLTGRVFANNRQALAMTEGPTEIVKEYFKAVKADSLVESILIHVDRKIPVREFKTYSVWLNLPGAFEFGDKVRELTPESVLTAMPVKQSAKLRIMAEAYLNADLIEKIRVEHVA